MRRRLPDHYRTCSSEPLDAICIASGDPIHEMTRTGGRRQTSYIDHVLHRYRHPVQRTPVSTCGQFSIGGGCGRTSSGHVDGDERVDCRLRALGLLDSNPDQVR
jgi:hypothetical protein